MLDKINKMVYTENNNITYPSQLGIMKTNIQKINTIQLTEKPIIFVMDKFFEGKIAPDNPNSLLGWIHLYFQVHVVGSPEKTITAKKNDLSKFLDFFGKWIGNDHIDNWTPAVSKQFQAVLKNKISIHTNKPFKPTTINRIMATVKHFSKWVTDRRKLLAGDPFAGVKDIEVDPPDWNGLTNKQIMRLKAACEQRMKTCDRADQNPLLETTVFYTLLQTGLRESELVSLNFEHYNNRGFHNVQRKGNRISRKVPVPADAKKLLDLYLAKRNVKENQPLFISRYGNRLSAQDVARICLRISKQASVFLNKNDKIKLTPHMLRHTFLKRVADKHGIHVAQQMSGNISIQEIFRYTKPNQDEIDETAENLFQ